MRIIARPAGDFNEVWLMRDEAGIKIHSESRNMRSTQHQAFSWFSTGRARPTSCLRLTNTRALVEDRDVAEDILRNCLAAAGPSFGTPAPRAAPPRRWR